MNIYYVIEDYGFTYEAVGGFKTKFEALDYVNNSISKDSYPIKYYITKIVDMYPRIEANV